MGVEPEDEFVSEDELKSLLDRWIVPEPSRVLDKRIATSFQREVTGADGLSQSVLLPQRREEVVLMKFCTRCEEEFADKFSFCPVDGTPLTAVELKPDDEPSLTISKEEPEPWVENNGSYPNESVVESTPVSTQPVFAATSALALREEYHLTIMDDAGLLARLSHELKDVAHEYELTWPEFKRDPFGFTKRTFIGYGQMLKKFLSIPYIRIAIGAGFVAMMALVGVVMLMDRTQSTRTSRLGLIGFSMLAAGLLIALFTTWIGRERGAAVMGAEPSDSRSVIFAMVASFVFLFVILGIVIGLDYRHRQYLAQNPNQEDLEVQQMLDIPNEQPTPDPGTAGLNKGSGGGSKPKPERAQGGGGGGREEQKPASFGKPPQASLDIPQVVAPDPKPPQIKNPSLPVAATVVADPMLVPPDTRVLPYGDYKSKSTDPSSGPGTGNGIGTGQGGGIGPGEGGGLGPGRGGNMGGGDFNAGGGGPGGGGGGDYNRIFTGKDVTSKARLISKPEPQYTEDARKNQITGTVVLKVVFASSGQVTNIRTVSGLPYGLTERAIAAARLIKFVPATKDGHQVSMWMQLEYNFNLY
ncbi:MAG TPA: TonB family protein [Pyrinomonadaceae bacterium]|jgi:TonB family protein|nr:TonB family protein [Pyrinomonadaceae bacterium]